MADRHRPRTRRRNGALRRFARRHAFLLWIEAAEQTVVFRVWSGREIECIDRAAVTAVAELKSPESVDDENPTLRGTHYIDEFAGDRVIGIDMAVAEVADP
jgi:hypothetical protein